MNHRGCAVAERLLAGLDRADRAKPTAPFSHVAGNALGGDACPTADGDDDACAGAAPPDTASGCDELPITSSR